MKVRYMNQGIEDSSNEALDLSALLRPYENQWVALSADASEVLGAGPTLGDAKREAEKTGKPHHFLHVLPFDVSYAFSGYSSALSL